MRLQALDLLRFIAALAVVLYHYTAQPNPTFPQIAQFTQFGYLGVPLFFMISGFVIAASAERRSPLIFMISRAARLYPAFWIGVLFTTTIMFALGASTPSTTDILLNLTMLNDYVGVNNIDGVYWTLQVELKFYGCIFLLMIFRLFTRYSLWLPIWLAITLSYLLFGQPSKMGWVINPGYSCYFISGICLYLLWNQKHTPVTNATLIISSLLCSYQSYHQAAGFMHSSEPYEWVIAAIIAGIFHGFFLLIALSKFTLSPLNIYTILGGLTYPLYLLHNHAGKLLIDRLKPLLSESIAIFFTTLLMLALSYLIYRFIEPQGARFFKTSFEQLFRIKRKSPSEAISKNN
ncbi:Lct55 [Cellvibrio sp. BR]|uniref:acyltransferase family protein n=1 Tax=Cellvibrio sp. BR TaxID=1134474 RepID=UPI0002601378|nr:acyltransferase [Cellvibrio sp. BR]EIK46724.1 Lct55 [Cellvibrio sp. BR]